MIPKKDNGKTPKGIYRTILIIAEVILFLLAWALLFLGIFSGYFAIFLIIFMGVIVVITLRDKTDSDEE